MKQIELFKNLCRHLKKKMLIGALMLFISNIIYAQNTTVHGIITDELKNPIPGANVSIEGTTNGTLSDTDGKFSLKIPSENSVLIVSFIGYEIQKIKPNGSELIKVILNQKVEELDNIVVVGYGVQKKSDLTGAVASVS